MRAIRLIATLAMLLPGVLHAEANVTGKLPGEAAVGRLMLSGKAMCTGALISPSLVLTAAHCLYNPRTGKKLKPGQIEFQAGLKGGKAKAIRQVSVATAHPDYIHRHKGKAQVGSDIALLRLSKPISKNSVLPMRYGANLASGDMLGVLSYTISNRSDPILEYPCRVLARQDETLVMSCEVNFGASGAPVLALTNGSNPAVVSVVSAKAAMGGQNVSVGTLLSADTLKQMIAGG
ncbi:trypsin-like serine protease [uncultured Shimia sp.]|uniref:trypsin-like serine peptidase n=1 Tax=uncultured Shimia sp. TaxID=573152 RepID=UPI0026135ACC|nr:trypsin-like serine protease [uncultured Shimia sp.]